MADAQNDATQVADQPERAQQSVTVEDIGPARKLLTIEVPRERIASTVQDSYTKLKDEAAIPGFRKGRAPVKLLEKRFGETVRGDVRRQLLTECYTQAVESESLDVIGEPEIKDADNIEIPEDGPLIFKVEIEVSPQVELPKLEGLKINKPPFAVTDKDVAEEIQRLLLRVGQPTEHRDTKVKADDVILADVRILPGNNANDDAEPITHQPETLIVVPGKGNKGKGHVSGIPIEDLEKQLIGQKTGDTVRLSVQGPAGHEDEKIQDQPLTIVVQINVVQRREPGTIDQLLHSAGFETEDQLRELVNQMLTARAEREQRTVIHKQICTFLTDNVEIELPEKMTARQSARILQRQAMQMAYQGIPREQIEQQVAQLRQDSQEQARQQLKLFFVLDQAAKSLDIQVTEGEVNGQIAQLAQQQGRRPEKQRRQMQKDGELDHLYLMIREQKTLDAILDKADVTITEAPEEETKKSAGDEAEDTPKKKTTKTKKTDATDNPKPKTPSAKAGAKPTPTPTPKSTQSTPDPKTTKTKKAD